MAIRTLMIRKNLDDAKKKREALETRAAELEKREAELIEAIEEASTDEEKEVVRSEVESYEEDKKALDDERGELDDTIEELEGELEKEEEAQDRAAEPKKTEPEKSETREETNTMNKRDALNSIIQREEMQSFLTNVREAIKEQRAITGGELTIPEVLLPIVREETARESKLIPFVNYQRVSGNAREVIMGEIPEAVWTEACGNINELSLIFTDVEVESYAVGGYFAICKATLRDSDYDLAEQLVYALAVAIAKAIDKAIIYGTDVKMPNGIVTELAGGDLATDHVITGQGNTGLDLIQEIIANAGVASSSYGGDRIFVMNGATKAKIQAQTLAANAQGAIVSGFEDRFPATGDRIVEVSADVIPDDNIVVGYFSKYLLAERASMTIERYRETLALQRRDVFIGEAYFDGTPVIPEAFVVMSINTTAPITSATFAPDTANTVSA